MVVVPLSKPANAMEVGPRVRQAENNQLVRIAAGVALIGGGLLLINGRRRAGLAVTATGAALALLDQQDTLRAWWNILPGYLNEAQSLLGHVQGAISDMSTRQEKLRALVYR